MRSNYSIAKALLMLLIAFQEQVCANLPACAFVSGSLKESRVKKGMAPHFHPLSLSSRGGVKKRTGYLLFDKEDDNSANSDIVWKSLATTEKWIQETLGFRDERNEPRQPTPLAAGDKNNPYTRKEVQYECEESKTLVGVMAGIFSRLRTLREVGDSHCDEMQEISSSLEGVEKKFKKYQSTLRQTVVVVAPSCSVINESFELFDAMVQVTNQARREARDYVLDVKHVVADEEEEWVTSLNLSHLHPQFYYESPGSEKKDVDPKIQMYKEQRKKARQSPFPTFVFEVKASPHKPLSSPKDKQMSSKTTLSNIGDDDVKKLEALFGKSAAKSSFEEPTETCNDPATMAVDKFASSILSPIGQGQTWLAEHLPDTVMKGASFDICSATQADEVLEFVFNKLVEASREKSQHRHSFILLPCFCSKSATSFEKFNIQLCALMAFLHFETNKEAAAALEGIRLDGFYHPEHIDKNNRSPIPILSLEFSPMQRYMNYLDDELDTQDAFQ